MNSYKHLLFAMDFNQDTLAAVEKVKSIAKKDDAKLSLFHVVEMVPVSVYSELMIPMQLEMEKQLAKSAKQKLAELAQANGLDEKDAHVQIGIGKIEILQFAADHGVDLIVLGNHSRHGFSRVLGSTANAVISHAECDVLAMKL